MWGELMLARRRASLALRTEAIIMHTVIAHCIAGGDALTTLLEGLERGRD